MSEEAGKIARWAGSKLKEAYKDYVVKQLIDQAFSKDPATRAIARAKLKKEYPEIYQELDLHEAKQTGEP